MKWVDLIKEQCSVARSSAVLGDRWTLVLLSDVFLGASRFEDFQSRLGMSRTTLANRLKLLEDHDVLEAHRYQTKPDRYEYRLTKKGLDLYPIISTMVSWGDKYYTPSAGPPILRRHTTCGHDIQPELVCPECGDPVDAKNIQTRKRENRRGVASVVRGPFAVED